MLLRFIWINIYRSWIHSLEIVNVDKYCASTHADSLTAYIIFPNVTYVSFLFFSAHMTKKWSEICWISSEAIIKAVIEIGEYFIISVTVDKECVITCSFYWIPQFSSSLILSVSSWWCVKPRLLSMND